MTCNCSLLPWQLLNPFLVKNMSDMEIRSNDNKKCKSSDKNTKTMYRVVMDGSLPNVRAIDIRNKSLAINYCMALLKGNSSDNLQPDRCGISSCFCQGKKNQSKSKSCRP